MIDWLLQLLPVLVDNASNIQVALAPDRTQVAFSSNRNGNFDIYVMDPDGQRLRRLTSTPAHEGEPAWTPDGRHIILASEGGLVAVDRTTFEVKKILHGSVNKKLSKISVSTLANFNHFIIYIIVVCSFCINLSRNL